MDNKAFYTKTMAGVYADQGHYAKAREIYHYLLQSAPGDPELTAALEALAEKEHPGPETRLKLLFTQWIELLLAQNRLAKLDNLMDNRKRR